MEYVTVDKTKLLDVLQENKKAHVDTFEQVLQDYRDEAVRLLEEHIDRIRNGKVEHVKVMLPPPQNYEKEYERAIQMVDWNTEENIQLDERTFDQWVLDNWAWKHEFNQTVATYSAR